MSGSVLVFVVMPLVRSQTSASPTENRLIALWDARSVLDGRVRPAGGAGASTESGPSLTEQLQRPLQHQFNVAVESVPEGADGVLCTPKLPPWVDPSFLEGCEFDDVLGATEAVCPPKDIAGGASEPEIVSASRFICSSADATIPHLDRLNKPGSTIQPVSVHSDVMGILRELGRHMDGCRASPFKEKVNRSQEVWRTLETEVLGPIVQELQDVLSVSVLPFNRCTRRRPDFVGSSLSTRGLIRCSCLTQCCCPVRVCHIAVLATICPGTS